MVRKLVSRLLLGGLVAAIIGAVAAAPALAYGSNDTWQTTFAGTLTSPGAGGFGFWGWCAFAGVSSGTDGDCQFAEYVHSTSGGGFTCQESVNISQWDISSTTGDFEILKANFTVNPSSLTGPCLFLFPGPNGLPVDSGVPAAPGHYNLNALFGRPGELQLQVTEVPTH
jgi:hypothetical protein